MFKRTGVHNHKSSQKKRHHRSAGANSYWITNSLGKNAAQGNLSQSLI